MRKKSSTIFSKAETAILSLFLLLSSIGIRAQQPAYYKMSPFVRSAVRGIAGRLPGSMPAMAAALGGRLTALVKTAEGAGSVAEDYGGRQLLQAGDISVVSLPLSSIASLSRDPRILRIEAGPVSHIDMDTTRTLIDAMPVYPGSCLASDLPQGYNGENVVVGVQDIGFDLTHPTFYSRDMKRYRIMALWDQLSTDTVGSSLPAGRDYTSREVLLSIGCPRDGYIQTHGTHTAGIAAGSGMEGDGVQSAYVGMAPEADLCLVCNATADDISLIDTADYYKYTYALDALGFKYIFDYADRVGKPCVINFSEGSGEDIHGYDNLYYELLSRLTGPGHIIVASAGNNGENLNYVYKSPDSLSAGEFILGDGKAFGATCQSKSSFTIRLRFFADGDKPVALNIPTDDVNEAEDSTLYDTISVGSRTYTVVVGSYPNSYDNSATAYDITVTSSSNIGKDEPVSLEMVGEGVEAQMYIVRGYFWNCSADPSLADGDNSHSIHSPSSAPNVICVGANGYRTGFKNYLGDWKYYPAGTSGTVTSYSSRGPTIDGRTKPDVVAPGQNIISAYSSFYINNKENVGNDINSDVRHFLWNGTTYAWNANSGTSMSAPVVTGAIALWLQANPRLTPDNCFEIFSKTCRRPDNSLSYPNNSYGYGEIDVYEGLKVALKMAADGVQSIDTSLGKSRSFKTIYNILGQRVSPVGLPHGIYIIGRKKVMK